ncbi:MAG: helix-turn-helix transcriptional regulator [Proteobacteria bacterium]|nr:helix-turn-helix transcriptional regulator [Pseudomonadota bacterium]
MQKSTHTRQYRVFLDGLIQARKDAGLTQQQVADKLGRPQSFVAKYENGERRLDVVEFLEIANLLDADPHGIIDAISG